MLPSTSMKQLTKTAITVQKETERMFVLFAAIYVNLSLDVLKWHEVDRAALFLPLSCELDMSRLFLSYDCCVPVST